MAYRSLSQRPPAAVGVTAALSFRGSERALLLLAGGVAYIGWLIVRKPPSIPSVPARDREVAGALLLLIATLFSIAWLGEIIPALAKGVVPLRSSIPVCRRTRSTRWTFPACSPRISSQASRCCAARGSGSSSLPCNRAVTPNLRVVAKIAPMTLLSTSIPCWYVLNAPHGVQAYVVQWSL